MHMDRYRLASDISTAIDQLEEVARFLRNSDRTQTIAPATAYAYWHDACSTLIQLNAAVGTTISEEIPQSKPTVSIKVDEVIHLKGGSYTPVKCVVKATDKDGQTTAYDHYTNTYTVVHADGETGTYHASELLWSDDFE